ncbi:MAG: NAD-dependent epimerase/dehydratase family protein [Saprospiraceae bacterium]
MDKHTPILVTGATGFVGAYTVKALLAAGFTRIHAIHRSGVVRRDLLGDAAIKWFGVKPIW